VSQTVFAMTIRSLNSWKSHSKLPGNHWRTGKLDDGAAASRFLSDTILKLASAKIDPIRFHLHLAAEFAF
jgi:hypothetical protein